MIGDLFLQIVPANIVWSEYRMMASDFCTSLRLIIALMARRDGEGFREAKDVTIGRVVGNGFHVAIISSRLFEKKLFGGLVIQNELLKKIKKKGNSKPPIQPNSPHRATRVYYTRPSLRCVPFRLILDNIQNRANKL